MSFVMKAELLTEISPIEAKFFIQSDKYGAQEKRNGKRRIIIKNDGQIYCFNREGEKRNLPEILVKIFLNHPLERFAIDTELEKTVLNPLVSIWDSIIMADELLGAEEYEYRERRTHEEFDNFHPQVQVLITARTPEAKLALVEKLWYARAEGAVFKLMSAPYKQGDSKQHKKLKFVKNLDAVVIGPSPKGKDSVELGLYRNGKLHRICGASLIGKQKISSGDVVEICYLYGTRTLHVVQPRIMMKRDDKSPRSCTVDQIVINRDFDLKDLQ